jgi:hypothetical protein
MCKADVSMTGSNHDRPGKSMYDIANMSLRIQLTLWNSVYQFQGNRPKHLPIKTLLESSTPHLEWQARTESVNGIFVVLRKHLSHSNSWLFSPSKSTIVSSSRKQPERAKAELHLSGKDWPSGEQDEDIGRPQNAPEVSWTEDNRTASVFTINLWPLFTENRFPNYTALLVA